jgi:tellurite resistance protein
MDSSNYIKAIQTSPATRASDLQKAIELAKADGKISEAELNTLREKF